MCVCACAWLIDWRFSWIWANIPPKNSPRVHTIFAWSTRSSNTLSFSAPPKFANSLLFHPPINAHRQFKMPGHVSTADSGHRRTNGKFRPWSWYLFSTNLVLLKLQSSPEAMFKAMFRYVPDSVGLFVCSSLENRQLTGSHWNRS